MSDTIGILVAGGLVLHLVDYDRPVWLQPERPSGLRVIPARHQMLSDALAVFEQGFQSSCEIGCGDRPMDALIDLDLQPCEHLNLAQATVRAAVEPAVILLSRHGIDPWMSLDSRLLSRPIVMLEVSDADAEQLGLA